VHFQRHQSHFRYVELTAYNISELFLCFIF